MCEDLCSAQHDTDEGKLVKLSGEWFCHNNGMKRLTGNVLVIVGPWHCHDVGNSTKTKSWATV